MYLKELILYAETMASTAKDLYVNGDKGKAAMCLSKFAFAISNNIKFDKSFASYIERSPETEIHPKKSN